MNIISINGLQTQAIIGCQPWERQVKQKLLFDIEFHLPNGKTTQEDDINATVDYSQLAERVIELVEASQFKLLESLAAKISHSLLREFDITTLSLKITKPNAVQNAQSVSISLQQTKDDI